MRKYFLTLILLISGCTTYSNNHYELMLAPTHSEKERVTETLKSVIEPIALKYGLKSETKLQTSEKVLLYYSSGGDSALRVGVRIDSGKVVLDTFQYWPGAGDTEQYTGLRSELIKAISQLNMVYIKEVDGPII